jgi:hypothetical protein
MRGTARLSQVFPPQKPIRFPYTLFALLRNAESRTIRVAIAAVAIAWIPAAILAAIRGFDSLRSFLTDFAAQPRLLVVIPLLIIAEPPLLTLQKKIANHFRDEGLIPEQDAPRFDNALRALSRRERPIAGIVMVSLAYILLAFGMPTLTAGSLMPWCYGHGGIADFSPAGSWYILVGFPMLVFVLLHWVWRQLVWLWFLGVASRMDLQLIASHPDRSGGLSFVEQCIRACLPFSFAVGTVVAGGVANRVVNLHQPITAFRYTALPVIAIVLMVCAGPLCVFWGTLLGARRRGILEYGALATRMGRQFEHKWLQMPSNRDGALDVQDFSATIDMYSVVANVHEMNFVPVGMLSLGRLTGWALAPAVPLLFVAFPFDVIMEHLLKLLF